MSVSRVMVVCGEYFHVAVTGPASAGGDWLPELLTAITRK